MTAGGPPPPVLPLLRPSLGALAVWSFLQTYNSFLWPLVLISDAQSYTLPLGLNILYASENRAFDLVPAQTTPRRPRRGRRQGLTHPSPTTERTPCST